MKIKIPVLIDAPGFFYALNCRAIVLFFQLNFYRAVAGFIREFAQRTFY
jgi:hypothetical protein